MEINQMLSQLRLDNKFLMMFINNLKMKIQY